MANAKLLCSVHRIPMHEAILYSLGGNFSNAHMRCEACDIEAYFPWHRAEAKRLKLSNPVLAQKHLDGIERSKQKIRDMSKAKSH